MSNKYTEAPLVLDGSVYNIDVPELIQHRVAAATIDFSNTAGSVAGSIVAIFPHGAIITGLRVMGVAQTDKSAASATMVPRIGTIPLTATNVISDYPDTIVPAISALVSTDGLFINLGGTTATAAFNVSFQASVNSACTAQYYYYIDYLYIYD